MSQPLDMFVEAVGIQPLDRVHDPTVKLLATLLKETAVGDLVGQRMLERVLQLREQTHLVQKLGRLKSGQSAS